MKHFLITVIVVIAYSCSSESTEATLKDNLVTTEITEQNYAITPQVEILETPSEYISKLDILLSQNPDDSCDLLIKKLICFAALKNSSNLKATTHKFHDLNDKNFVLTNADLEELSTYGISHKFDDQRRYIEFYIDTLKIYQMTQMTSKSFISDTVIYGQPYKYNSAEMHVK